MDQKENLIDKDLSLVVVLPGGIEKMTTVHGSKPLMDLLVMLCATYHLNPSSHTLELVTANRNNIKLKPNALIGTLDAEKIILKPKGEDKNKKTSPQMPEATVRMVINYRKTQKTILRVNPRVPLVQLLPAICEKCEFAQESTVLLRDVQSLAPLDLTSSLNDYALREVYARDTKGIPGSPVCPASPAHTGMVMPGKAKNQKEKENKGLFSKFRKSKKNSDQATTASAPASPVLVSKPRPLSMALPSTNSSPLSSPLSPTDGPKKRRAPLPPVFSFQSGASDLSARRRINSEPNTQVDGDQAAGLSRGSSAESSLKRTKRKAPPPPRSPGAVVPETVPLEENGQGGAAANTLEEIMEQEETTPSVMSAGDTQEEDGSLSASADVSLQSPAADTDIPVPVPMEGSEEDQTCDLSSDGNQLQSTVDIPATLSDVTTTADKDSSELADTNDGPGRVETVIQQPVCEESTAQSVEGDGRTEAVSVSPPVMQEAEAQASIQANTETLGEQADRLESPVAISTSRPAGEDAEVQTDFTPFPPPPPPHAEEVPSAADPPCVESSGKHEMATLTGELDLPDLERRALSDIPETSPPQESEPSAPAATKAANIYATDSEPKPKPSNELTRDYIPKVGMTTYTIVPQKSLEKLRYFEVALTLEMPPPPPEEGLDIGSLQLEESTAPRGQTATAPREDLLTSTATAQDTVNGDAPESTPSPEKMSALANGASQTGSPTEVKEMKIPPATKPKPGSFRLTQHKKTPGYYVTSAADKRISTSPGYGQREAPGGVDRAVSLPPPPSPPAQCQEDTTGTSNVQLSPKGEDKNPAVMRMTRQSSLPCKEPSLGMSLEKLRSFAAARPYAPVNPSRFAQAVTSAVKRSQSLSHGPKSPQSPPISPITNRPAAVETKGSSQLKDEENKDSDKDALLQGAEGELPTVSGIIEMEGESGP
ncbi:cordon-bleu protein-like 1b isoform X2 [Platichthys flesus]|nr:cordon-bleu protein-like 1b isoform X2 [Platichthys flesus]XP_062259113.1 cordon-bleu protein-like 1b isoform X2 [Platichthys flesus]